MDTHIYSDPERSLTNLRYESKAFDLAKIQVVPINVGYGRGCAIYAGYKITPN
jgi:hypothetical protein